MEMNINGRPVGDGHSCYVIAEIGINHNGSLEIARRLIRAAAAAGCDAVKFQKRTVDVVYAAEELAKPRESPFGRTNGDLKRGLEFGSKEYEEIDRCCRESGVNWFASCWDEASVDFIERFDTPAHKIASACLTDHPLLERIAATGKPILVSTGMSKLQEIDAAASILGRYGVPWAVLHCVATYPSDNRQLNLRCIQALQERYGVPCGWSGHERGLATTIAAVALGASIVERHITLDRTMWGSDQSASLEPHALCRLVRDIRAVEAAMGDGVKLVLPDEVPIREKLRRVPWPTT